MKQKLLYKNIMEHIQSAIINRELKSNDQVPSESELSEKFSVSRITAKKALDELERGGFIYRVKGSGSFVCEKRDTKEISEDSTAGKPNFIALIMPFGSSLGRAMDVIQGISNIISTKGYYLTLHISNRKPEQEREIINNLVNDNVSGIILYPVSHRKNIDLINRLVLRNYPIITIDKYFDAFPVNCVLSDNFNGGYMAASYLIELGHRKLVFVAESDLESATSVRDRYLGFCRALADHSLPIHENHVVLVDDLSEEVYDSLKGGDFSQSNVLDPFKRVVDSVLKTGCTAVEAVHDYMAIFLIKAALSMGIKVPEELSVVGFDNIGKSAYIEVPLTTLEQDFYRIGQESAKLVMDKIANPATECRKVVLPVEMTRRDSVVAPKIPEKSETAPEAARLYSRFLS